MEVVLAICPFCEGGESKTEQIKILDSLTIPLTDKNGGKFFGMRLDSDYEYVKASKCGHSYLRKESKTEIKRE